MKEKCLSILSVLALSAALTVSGCGDAEKMDSQSFDSTATRAIEIVSGKGDIELMPSNVDQIEVGLYASGDARQNFKLLTSEQGGTLRLEVENSRSNNGLSFAKLRVDVPKKQFEQITLQSTSGVINVSGVNATSATLLSDSGSIEARNITGHQLDITTGAGSIVTEKINIDGSVTFQNAGTQTANGLQAKTVAFDSRGGLLDLRQVKAQDSLTATTTSGAIQLEMPEMVNGRLQLNSRSGNLILILPQSAQFSYSTSTAAGLVINKFQNNKSAGIIGQGGPQVELNTASGDITLSNTTNDLTSFNQPTQQAQ